MTDTMMTKIDEMPEGGRRNEDLAYSDMVARLVKPGEAVLAGMDPAAADLVHMALGVAGEAGELVDAIKRSAIYGRALDVGNVIEELGDIEFYMEHIRQILGVPRSFVLARNAAKLGVRYGAGYSDGAAQARADKVEGGG
jgi:NTP pyrophosphatase (non-canonical NTP hydrolase)